MDKNKIYIWVLIIAVAILVSAAIIFPPALAHSGYKVYLENKEISSESAANPEAVAQAFYNVYLESFGNPSTDNFRNPLAEKIYQDSEYLTPGFIGHMDEILANFDDQHGYDPFLCAQDISQEMKADGTFFHGEQASVIMRSDFPNHVITVDLQRINEDWKIGNITCSGSPEGTAKAFYTWYLAYIGSRVSDGMRNPLVDKSYQDCGFLSAELIQDLDKLTAKGIPADPILMAQDIPQDFTVDPGTESGTAIVHLQFGTEIVHHLKVSMVEEMGAWKIIEIEQAK